MQNMHEKFVMHRKTMFPIHDRVVMYTLSVLPKEKAGCA